MESKHPYDRIEATLTEIAEVIVSPIRRRDQAQADLAAFREMRAEHRAQAEEVARLRAVMWEAVRGWAEVLSRNVKALEATHVLTSKE